MVYIIISLYKELLNSAFQTEDILRAQQQSGT
jgi:hypothetical protein